MLKFSLLLAAAVFLFSCKQGTDKNIPPNASNNTVIDTVAIIDDPKNNLNIQTNSFTEIDSSGIIMLPLSMEETKNNRGSLKYREMPGNNYWNIIFYNCKTSDYHLLSDRKMLISNFDIQYQSSDLTYVTYTGKHIFFRVTTEDFNKDKKINSDDPEYLFVTDREGNNFKQISPAGCSLKSWQFIRSANKIIMTVIKDSDNNKEFGDKDEVATFELDVEKENEPTEIFTKNFKNSLKVMYDKDWQGVKEQ